MISRNIRENLSPIINPLIEEGFWSLDNIIVELDYNEGLISAGSCDLERFSIDKTKEIIQLIILSITKGEYILPDSLLFLKEFAQKLTLIKENALYFEQDNLNFNNKFFQDNFILPLNFCITHYISLIVHLNNIFNLENTDYLFEYNSDEENNIYLKNETKEEVAKWLHLFSFNINVVGIENQFSITEEDYSSLLKISSDLNNNDYNSVYKNILKQKSDYLRYKWVTRRKESGNTVKFLQDGSFIEPQFEDSTNVFINKWKEDITFHYSDNNTGNERFRKIYNDLKIKPLNLLTLKEIHQLIKYTKDFKKDYSSLCDYVEELKSRENLLNYSPFSRYIFTKDYNYALNNKFSFLVSSPKSKMEEINQLYLEIKDFQVRKEINNFFVNYKYLEYIVNELKKIDYKSPENYIVATTYHFSLGDSIIDNYKSDIKWSQKNLIFLYYFEYENSFTEINEIPVFLQSNFQLPLSPTKYLKEYNEVKNDFLKLKGKFDVYEKIDPQVKKVNELEKKDLKDLERLSLFTAVISFIIGGVSGFSFINDIYSAIVFLIIFSMSLTSFLIVLFIFTRGKNALNWSNIALILMMYSMFGIGLFTTKSMFKTDYLNKIDTIQKDVSIMKNKLKNSTPKKK